MSSSNTPIARAILGVANLEITNDGLDEKFVQELTAALAAGEISPEEIRSSPIYVRLIEGRGYCVNDGNNTVAALKRAGIKAVQADVYKLP